jgi:hypothetical protein
LSSFLQITYPPGLTREQILEDARTTVPRWRANKELISKHYLLAKMAPVARCIWPSKEAAQRGHQRRMVREHQGPHRLGTDYPLFDLTMIVDNEAGSVIEFPPAAAQAAE